MLQPKRFVEVDSGLEQRVVRMEQHELVVETMTMIAIEVEEEDDRLELEGM